MSCQNVNPTEDVSNRVLDKFRCNNNEMGVEDGLKIVRWFHMSEKVLMNEAWLSFVSMSDLADDIENDTGK